MLICTFFSSGGKKQKQWSEEELRDCFYVFDSDGNGSIDLEELFMACKMLGCDDDEAERLSEVRCEGWQGCEGWLGV